jgi:hypothetical protein
VAGLLPASEVIARTIDVIGRSIRSPMRTVEVRPRNGLGLGSWQRRRTHPYILLCIVIHVVYFARRVQTSLPARWQFTLRIFELVPIHCRAKRYRLRRRIAVVSGNSWAVGSALAAVPVREVSAARRARGDVAVVLIILLVESGWRISANVSRRLGYAFEI